MDYGKILQ
jgi:hypothetical protein